MLIAFKGTTVTKPSVLNQLRAHAKADAIVKGRYWEDGKGCAVGCTIHSGNHAEYEARFGVPQMLARLEDCIFEGLPNDKAKRWPVRFMEAVEPGSNLSYVGWKFLHWLLTDKTVNPGIDHPLVQNAVKQCADMLLPLTKGRPVDKSAANVVWSAESAASAARSAARAASAASAASAAWSAAWSAESAANVVWSAESAASAARSAESAANAANAASAASAANAASAARSAVWSAAWSAESAASAAYVAMSNKLIALIKDAPKP